MSEVLGIRLSGRTPVSLKLIRELMLAASLLGSGAAAWAEDAVNMTLSRLVAADQDARRDVAKIDWEVLRVEDAKRRAEVLEMLRAGRLKVAIDYENAALIFQHGAVPEDYRMAHSLATMAVALEPDRRFALWLQKASWDRLMLSLGKEQWFGTQSRVEKVE